MFPPNYSHKEASEILKGQNLGDTRSSTQSISKRSSNMFSQLKEFFKWLHFFSDALMKKPKLKKATTMETTAKVLFKIKLRLLITLFT
jgi:hypothetical protein